MNLFNNVKGVKILRFKYFKVLFLLLFLIVISFGAYYFINSRSIKSNGIPLTPSEDYPVQEIEYYLQNDPKWSDDMIGNSNYKISDAGCLITCLASAITDLGIDVTPKDVNNALTGVGGYEDADLIWNKINEAFPEINYKYKRVFNSKTIEEDLKDNILPIVNVKFNGTGITHWVIILGAENGDFLVSDPFNKGKKPIPLSTHGKVYAYRVLIRNQ